MIAKYYANGLKEIEAIKLEGQWNLFRLSCRSGKAMTNYSTKANDEKSVFVEASVTKVDDRCNTLPIQLFSSRYLPNGLWLITLKQIWSDLQTPSSSHPAVLSALSCVDVPDGSRTELRKRNQNCREISV